MATQAKVNVADIVDSSKVGSFHISIGVLCGMCLMIDGFDVQAMGYAAPALIRDWALAGPVMGPVFSAALFGILVGSLTFSTLADKVGRRPMLITATLFFSVLTFATAQAANLTQLMVLRFIAGVGLGGIMPNALALIGEYTPAKKRVSAMIVVANGFNLGAALGGFMAAWLIPNFGWRSVFYFGGAVPLVICVLMIFFLPESLQLMVMRGVDRRKIAQAVKKFNPAAPVDEKTEFIVKEEKKGGVPAMHLFSNGRGVVTVLLWSVFFLNLLNLYLLASWLPTLVSQLGYVTSTAVLVGTMLQAGGTIGGFLFPVITARMGLTPTLTLGFGIAALCIAGIGQFGATLGLLGVVVFFAGWGILGGQNGLNALAGSFYPTYLRSTGMGWCLGIGRIGAIIGPLFAGALIRRNLPQSQLFLAAASLALLEMVIIFALKFMIKPTKEDVAAAKEAMAH
jgi:AAHS family 4-hydroxybenzoate transporter-like MFS transporter